MFRDHSRHPGRIYQVAIIGLVLLSIAALAVTISVEFEFLHEQELIEELKRALPRESLGPAVELSGELRGQFRLITLVAFNMLVTGVAIAMLGRAYSDSQTTLRDLKVLAGDILNSMDQAVITTDARGKVTSSNRRGLEMLSLKSEPLGLSLAELSSTVPLAMFREEWMAEKSPSMSQDYRVRIDGADRVLRATGQTLSDIQNVEIGFVLQLRDVTNRVLIEERMRRMERYMGLGSLAVGLHHEIKNPLAALSLHVQLLEEEIENSEATEEVRQMLSVITTEISRIGNVLESFRDFASIDKLQLSSVNAIEVIRSQITLIEPSARKQSVQIRFDPHSLDSLPIAADRVRLEQVLLNLFVNAIQAMPLGGKLTIGVSTSNEMAVIEVSDSGVGIPEDLHDKIFDPYFTTKSDGTGLGLALCDKILRQHGGNLEFESSPRGSTFRMLLPTAHDTERGSLRRG